MCEPMYETRDAGSADSLPGSLPNAASGSMYFFSSRSRQRLRLTPIASVNDTLDTLHPHAGASDRGGRTLHVVTQISDIV